MNPTWTSGSLSCRPRHAVGTDVESDQDSEDGGTDAADGQRGGCADDGEYGDFPVGGVDGMMFPLVLVCDVQGGQHDVFALFSLSIQATRSPTFFY